MPYPEQEAESFFPVKSKYQIYPTWTILKVHNTVAIARSHKADIKSHIAYSYTSFHLGREEREQPQPNPSTNSKRLITTTIEY